jgi:hypothetical protein
MRPASLTFRYVASIHRYGQAPSMGQEGVHPFVDLLAKPRDLALGHARSAHCLDEVVDRPRRDPVHGGLLDHGGERLLGGAPGLQERGQIRALAQFGDGEVNPACARLPRSLPIAIPVVRRSGLRAPAGAPVRASTSNSIMRSAAKARSSRTRSPPAPFSISSIRAILSLVIVVSGPRFKRRNSNPSRRPAMRGRQPGQCSGRSLHPIPSGSSQDTDLRQERWPV